MAQGDAETVRPMLALCKPHRNLDERGSGPTENVGCRSSVSMKAARKFALLDMGDGNKIISGDHGKEKWELNGAARKASKTVTPS